MPNTHSTLTSLFSDIADAIRGKTGSSATIVADNFPTAIASIPTGGGSATIEPLSVTANGTYTAPSGVDGYSPITVNVSGGGGGSASDAVRFIDYDGTILHTYSAEDFAALTAMPANPTHTGLTSQGWNWTLADAKAQVTAMGSCDIGQMYVTDDGKTRVYISLVDSARLSPYLGISPNGTVVVDWGDGSSTNTLTGTSLTYTKWTQHTYSSTGDYVITLTVTSGSFAILGVNTSSNGSNLLTRVSSTFNSQRCYQNAIQKVELGANVSIGLYAFQYCYSLVSITMPSSLTTLNNYAFNYCYSLKSATIPNGVTSIPSNLFSYCFSLSNISMPNGVTNIGTYGFYACKSLLDLTIPSGVTSIGSSGFGSCGLLSNIVLPSGITSISDGLFQSCYSLTRLILPNNVTSIGSNAFRGCAALASVTIPNGVTSISDYAFYDCSSLLTITLPNSVTTLGAYVFNSCANLASAILPSNITSIGNYLFAACYSLASISIPDTVTSIGNYGFQTCYSLSSITIPSNVTSIGTYAFSSSNSIAEYHLLSATPPTLSNTNAFYNILADCKIYVPAESLEAYQTATNWSTYASKMVGE